MAPITSVGYLRGEQSVVYARDVTGFLEPCFIFKGNLSDHNKKIYSFFEVQHRVAPHVYDTLKDLLRDMYSPYPINSIFSRIANEGGTFLCSEFEQMYRSSSYAVIPDPFSFPSVPGSISVMHDSSCQQPNKIKEDDMFWMSKEELKRKVNELQHRLSLDESALEDAKRENTELKKSLTVVQANAEIREAELLCKINKRDAVIKGLTDDDKYKQLEADNKKLCKEIERLNLQIDSLEGRLQEKCIEASSLQIVNTELAYAKAALANYQAQEADPEYFNKLEKLVGFVSDLSARQSPVHVYNPDPARYKANM